MTKPKLTKEIALARYEMFTEAAGHLQGDITKDKCEQEQVKYVYNQIITLADYWLNKASKLPDKYKYEDYKEEVISDLQHDQ